MGLLSNLWSSVLGWQCSVFSGHSRSIQSSANSLQLVKQSKSLKSTSLKSNHFLSKKKASSLVEVVVATVIIIVIFGIVTLTLNNMIKNNYKSKTDAINNRLNKIIYLYQNGKINTPFQESFEGWEIQSEQKTENSQIGLSYLVFTATHQKTKKEIQKRILNEN